MSFRKEPLLECKSDIDEYTKYCLGYPTHGEFKPFFFNKHRAPLNIEGMYGDESLFVICGGPSLKSINFDLLRTPGVMLMTINNNAVTLLNRKITPRFSVFCDEPDSFISQILLNPAIQKFTPFGNHGKPMWDNEKWCSMDKSLKKQNNITYFFRNEKFMEKRWYKEASINWGLAKEIGDMRSTMLAAIKISYVLGFRKVYLLGCDFDMKKENSYAFNENRSDSLVRTNNKNYKILNDDILPKLKSQGELLNFFVYNCNKDSKMTAYEYISLETAVKNATEKCGPTDVIETKGLYNVEYIEKLKLTREQAIQKNS